MNNFKKVTYGLSLLTVMSVGIKTQPVSAAYSGSLEVNFTNISNSKGQICLNLFNGQRGFPDGGKGSALKVARCTPIVKGSAKFTLANLPYGNYAISAIHDTNGDTKLNSNFLGVPNEGVGFSNNPVVVTAAPKFSESQFFLSKVKTDISIKMQYFN